MTARPEVLLAIACCALVTVLPRVFPLLFSHKLNPPAWVVVWLRLVPASILAALLVPELLLDGSGGLLGAAEVAFAMLASLATIATFFALKRNMMVSFVAGVAAYAVLVNLAG